MRMILSTFLLLLSLGVSAQVTDFLPTQKTISRPFGLPIKVDLDGNIQFLTGDRDLVFAPAIQLNFDRTKVQYTIPEMASEFSLLPPRDSSGWVEFKRLRYEYGAGLLAVIKRSFRLGLAPFRGANISLRRLKSQKDAVISGGYSLPRELNEIENWSAGDQGSFQTFGGIQIFAGIDVGPLNVAGGSIGWQNQFNVTIERHPDGISLCIAEERLDRATLNAGIDLANVTLTNFRGKQLRAEFRLDFAIPAHHELYREALRGKLTSLEEKLPLERKKITWHGTDTSVYWGIPGIIGSTRSRGSYVVAEDEQEYFLEVIQHKKSGLLVSTSYQQKFVYHNDESILLLWTTDTKKSSPGQLRKHFFGPARAVGFKGFDIELDDEERYGTVIGEVGVVVTKSEVENFVNLDQSEVSKNLKARCQELELSCAKDSKVRGIMKKFSEAVKLDWEEMKKKIGVLLVKEPALFHALLRGTRLEKEAYFKFLSDRYQSLEGLTVLAI